MSTRLYCWCCGGQPETMSFLTCFGVWHGLFCTVNKRKGVVWLQWWFCEPVPPDQGHLTLSLARVLAGHG